jgi:putative acetyltransferase
MINIRLETPDDISTVRQLTVDAFSSCEFGHNGEADLVEVLRTNHTESISLIAERNEEQLGHLLFSPATIRTGDTLLSGMGLGPMSVTPNFQGEGIGSKLITQGLSLLNEKGCPFVLVLGHPTYYPRFGFDLSEKHHIEHGFKGIGQEYFFINFLDETIAPSVIGGRAFYSEEFGPQHE